MHEPYLIIRFLRPDEVLGHGSSGDRTIILKDMFSASVVSNAVFYRHGYSFVSDPPINHIIIMPKSLVTSLVIYVGVRAVALRSARRNASTNTHFLGSQPDLGVTRPQVKLWS